MTRWGVVRGGGFVALLVLVPALGPAHWQLNLLIFVLLFAAMAGAWNLVGGFSGYPSLGHAAFFGLGAYTLGLAFRGAQLGSGYEPLLALPLVGLAVGVVAWPVAAVAMRTRADVFAIVTITFLFVCQTLAFNLRDLSGGSQGLAFPIPPFDPAGFERPFYYAAVALLAVAMGLTFLTLRSKLGLSLAAVRADEDKARGIGVHVTGVKVLAFCVSAGLTAMAGGIWGYYESFVYPQFAFDPLVTIAVVLMTFLGGRATLWGPVLGALVLETGQQYLAYSLGGSQFYLIAYAGVFLVVMLLLPRGIVPTVAERLRLRRRARAGAGLDPRGPGVPGGPGGAGGAGGEPSAATGRAQGVAA
jgi:branched-chain amino acid transport system permease protein